MVDAARNPVNRSRLASFQTFSRATHRDRHKLGGGGMGALCMRRAFAQPFLANEGSRTSRRNTCLTVGRVALRCVALRCLDDCRQERSGRNAAPLARMPAMSRVA